MVIWRDATRIPYLITGFQSLDFLPCSPCLLLFLQATNVFNIISNHLQCHASILQHDTGAETAWKQSWWQLPRALLWSKCWNGILEQCWSLQDRLPFISGAAASDPLTDNRYLFQKHLVINTGAVKSLGERNIRSEIQEGKEIWEWEYIRMLLNSMYLSGDLTVYIRLT